MDFNLEHTLTCGQYFLWRRDGDGFIVRSRGVIARVRRTGTGLEIEGADLAWAEHLFGLSDPIDEIRDALSADPKLRPYINRQSGLCMMRQDPWECLVGFMLSPRSKIPRIQKQLWTLAGDGAIPRPQTRPDLAPLRAGYRVKGLTEAYRRVDETWLESIRGLNDDAARKKLMTLLGVGPKVSNCVLLYAYQRHRAFPVDAWILKRMKELTGSRSEDPTYYERVARDRWGLWAGYAQLYLFAARDGR